MHIYLDAPSVIINPSQSPFTVSVGTSLFLHCKAQGYPTPTVQWYTGRRPVVPIAQYFQQIFVVPTDSPNKREYSCIGRNNAGNKRRTVRKKISYCKRYKLVMVCSLHTLHCLYTIVLSLRYRIMDWS